MIAKMPAEAQSKIFSHLGKLSASEQEKWYKNQLEVVLKYKWQEQERERLHKQQPQPGVASSSVSPSPQQHPTPQHIGVKTEPQVIPTTVRLKLSCLYYFSSDQGGEVFGG